MLNFRRTPWRPAIAVLLGISLVLTLLIRAEPVTADPTSDSAPKTYLKYDGLGNYAEVANSPAFSLSKEGLTVAVWMRPRCAGISQARRPAGERAICALAWERTGGKSGVGISNVQPEAARPSQAPGKVEK